MLSWVGAQGAAGNKSMQVQYFIKTVYLGQLSDLFSRYRSPTCADSVPVIGRTGTVLSLSADGHPVALSTLQISDIARGVTGWAGLYVCDGKSAGRGVVVEDAATGCPGYHSCVGAAVQWSLKTAVGTGTYTGCHHSKNISYSLGNTQVSRDVLDFKSVWTF